MDAKNEICNDGNLDRLTIIRCFFRSIYNYIISILTETFPCQLINTITQPFDITIFVYSVLYLCIIIMIGIFLYWDTIYKTAKKYSKCNNISKIIDESVYTETPYVYTIVIINTKRIKKLSEYIIKITYDFNKMDTSIEYGNMEGEDTIFKHRFNDFKETIERIKDLETRKKELEALATRNEAQNVELRDIRLELLEIKNTEEGKIAYSLKDKLETRKKELEALATRNEAQNAELRNIRLELFEIKNTDEGAYTYSLKDLNTLSNEKRTFHNSFNYNYLNLTTMKSDTIEDISTRINSNDYKYYAVDKDFKMIHSYTTSELIKFTKGYSQNEYYPMSIIDYIIFSKLQRDKNINI